MSTEPMDWQAFMSARHLLAEERVGVPKRQRNRAEQAAVEDTKAWLRKLPPVPLAPRRDLATPVEPLIVKEGEITRGRVA